MSSLFPIVVARRSAPSWLKVRDLDGVHVYESCAGVSVAWFEPVRAVFASFSPRDCYSVKFYLSLSDALEAGFKFRSVEDFRAHEQTLCLA